MANHVILGGKVHVYKRENSRFWQCSTFLKGKNHRASTKEESLSQVKDFAEDCFFSLKDKDWRGELRYGKPFKTAVDQFLREYEVMTEGE